MRKTVRILLSLLACCLAASGQAQAPDAPERLIYFDYYTDRGALVILPLPPDMELIDIASATLDGALEVQSVGMTAATHDVDFLVLPLLPDATIFADRYTLQLTSGEEVVHEFGELALAPADAISGQLLPAESMSAPGVHVILAVALNNLGPGSVKIEGLQYLGRHYDDLFVRAAVTTTPGELLAALEYPPFPRLEPFESGLYLEGYTTYRADELEFELTEGEWAVILLLPDAFPRLGDVEYRIRPVIRYRNQEGETVSQGLPMQARWRSREAQRGE